MAARCFGPSWGLFVEMIVLIFVLTTFGEVLPMTLAVKYPERFLAFAGRIQPRPEAPPPQPRAYDADRVCQRDARILP